MSSLLLCSSVLVAVKGNTAFITLLGGVIAIVLVVIVVVMVL